MKYLKLLLVFLTCAVAARSQEVLSKLFARQQDVYLRVLLEKQNGFDIRSLTMSKATIEKAEKQGKQVRPTRTSNYVFSYWAFLADGSFKTLERYNYDRSHVDDHVLTYSELDAAFSKIPPAATWKKGEDLAVGSTHFSIRSLDADDPADGGKKGEIEIGWLKEGKPIYFYYCMPVATSD